MGILITLLLTTLLATVNSFFHYNPGYIDVGKSILLQCSVEETKKCEFKATSYQNRIEIKLNRENTIYDKFTITNANSCIIQIVNTTINDTGVYECQTDKGRSKFDITVVVNAAEEFMSYNGQRLPKNDNIIRPTKQDNVQFACHSYQSFPQAYFIMWYINGHYKKYIGVEQHSDYQTYQLRDFRSIVELNETNSLKSVTCIIGYEHHPVVTNFTATFAHPSTYVEFNFINSTSDYKNRFILEEDEKEEIICKTDGLPLPNILIKKKIENNQWIVIAEHKSHMIKLNLTDSGNYICQVQYHFDNDVQLDRNITSKRIIIQNYYKDQEMLKNTLSEMNNTLTIIHSKMEEKFREINKMFQKHFKLQDE